MFIFLGMTVVKDIPTYYIAAEEACAGSAVGASCTIAFTGGSVSVGVCGGEKLTCQIDANKVPSCRNSATGAAGGFAMIFALLAFITLARGRLIVA